VKIGDLVKYISDSEDFDANFFGADMFGIIEELEHYVPSLKCYEKIWVRWLDSADLQWADPDHLEVLSEAR
tara:strand:+ start:784 stop:996 length:213 start_codon:yes stop_codon:yes gene_type:complete